MGARNSILDALHIYDATAVADAGHPSWVRVMWSADGCAAALVINGFAHAMFDFETPLAMCAGSLPPGSPYVLTHDWDEAAFQRLFPGVASEWAWRRDQA